MLKILKHHHISFKNAFSGLIWAVKTQPNFRVHLIISSIALFLSYYFSITKFELIIIFFCIILGLTVEMLNTAVECMTDLITKEWNEEAKNAKDVSAGMMLVVAIGTLIVGSIIFIPYLLKI